jgi:hypothetical protein
MSNAEAPLSAAAIMFMREENAKDCWSGSDGSATL